MKIPDPTEEYILTIDACKDGLGAVLSQKHDNKEHVIAYASRLCNRYEGNYDTYSLECLALDFSLKVWRCYLLGVKFKVYTDNNALTYIKNKKDIGGKNYRMVMRFEEYDFDIIHKPGKQNVVADALSRNATLQVNVANNITNEECNDIENCDEEKKELSLLIIKTSDMQVLKLHTIH